MLLRFLAGFEAADPEHQRRNRVANAAANRGPDAVTIRSVYSMGPKPDAIPPVLGSFGRPHASVIRETCWVGDGSIFDQKWLANISPSLAADSDVLGFEVASFQRLGP